MHVFSFGFCFGLLVIVFNNVENWFLDTCYYYFIEIYICYFGFSTLFGWMDVFFCLLFCLQRVVRILPITLILSSLVT